MSKDWTQSLGKIPLDDDEDNLVIKHRFLNKTYASSRHWGTFSTEWSANFAVTDKADRFYGVNQREYNVSSLSYLVNGHYWAVR